MTRKETRSLREKPSWSLKTLVRDCTNTGLGANISLLLQGSTLQIPTTTTATPGITDQRYRCLSLTGRSPPHCRYGKDTDSFWQGWVGNIPCEHSSTCFSCRHRSLEGELLAEDGQAAEKDQLPRATLRFYEQEP